MRGMSHRWRERRSRGKEQRDASSKTKSSALHKVLLFSQGSVRILLLMERVKRTGRTSTLLPLPGHAGHTAVFTFSKKRPRSNAEAGRNMFSPGS
jgi:hypothetical protein